MGSIYSGQIPTSFGYRKKPHGEKIKSNRVGKKLSQFFLEKRSRIATVKNNTLNVSNFA